MAKTEEQRAQIAKQAGGNTRWGMKRDALIKVLQAAQVHNEDGEMMLDFEAQGRDSLDFGTVSRAGLKAMLDAAFEAGAEHARTFK